MAKRTLAEQFEKEEKAGKFFDIVGWILVFHTIALGTLILLILIR